jgi:CheY-like chemotaxis protein
MASLLLVEDSKTQMLATSRALQRGGHTVISAADGDEALLLAREKLPDIILLDMMLPKMSGDGVLKALKADPTTRAIPVIVLSGLSEKNAGRLVADGAISFFEKSQLERSNGPDLLRAAVEQVLKKSTRPSHGAIPFVRALFSGKH